MPKQRLWPMRDEGGITLEAALIVPFFFAFVLAIFALFQLAMMETELQSAVSEAVKEGAAQIYPIEQLYQQGKSRLGETRASVVLNDLIQRLQAARGHVVDAEQGAVQLADWIPEPILQLIEWEKDRRERLEAAGEGKLEGWTNDALNGAAREYVFMFAHGSRLKKDRLHVVDVEFPDLDGKGDGYLGITVQYEVPLAVPFIRKTILLEEKAYERAWIGNGGD